MLDRRLYKLGSLLGLLAIWLIALAPTISQTLAAHRHAHGDAVPGVECAMHGGGMSMPMPMHMRMPMQGADGHASHRPDAQGDWQACGYCGFFAHLPVLTGLAPALVPAFAAGPISYLAQFVEPSRVARFLAAQPRAPPVVS
ncbi:DUF2946 domain-containing protein [Trinickia dinghuensis]|uniref:DUF2946 domain-containing protein n=1 Tax=Trinickia dinghuensis TaxID=2291023 RepID=A0A3D8JR67_9BURK|nr:DUF2946 domain-containing protein [Trinickia dinghuensis]RDU94911.1 DUF2946 domain-containing protein [Trinickia dinghuensis]